MTAGTFVPAISSARSGKNERFWETVSGSHKNGWGTLPEVLEKTSPSLGS
jgi:hypothetical protein